METVETVTLATMTTIQAAIKPAKCVDHMYCSVFANQCTANRRIRLICPITCGICDGEGDLIPDSEQIADESVKVKKIKTQQSFKIL